MQERKKVAIIGSGCTGIAALWALQSTNHEVHLFEAKERLGGHTNTVPFKHEGKTVNVDTGFIVMNSATYPNFTTFLKEVNIPVVPTDMTFGVSRDQGLFEWSGTSVPAIFAQKSNIFKPRMWQMIFDIIRFNQFALDLLSKEDESEIDISGANGSAKHVGKPAHQQSIGEYLDQEGYSEAFRNDYLIPMTASVWSTSPDKASLEFPAITLIRFMWNHHLLTTVAARPTWMTIVGGSKQYIDAVMRGFPEDHVHLGTAIQSLSTLENDQLAVHRTDGRREVFDHVILATHGDQAKDIIRDIATPQEIDIMSGFKTSKNTAVLHSDRLLMPKRYVAWSSWNYITTSPSPTTTPSVCLTYWMNLLQHIPSLYGLVLVTLNPLHPPRSAQGSWTYHHPLYNAAAIRSQKLLPCIQNTRGISYAGAWTKYGFHEDGFSSGLKVAVEHLGAKLPFEFVDSTFSRGRRPVLGWMDYTNSYFQYSLFAQQPTSHPPPIIRPRNGLHDLAARLLFARILGNSVLAFVTSQPFHHTGRSVTVVGLSLLLLLLESLENLRRRLTRATRIVHRPPPSTSRLLLLPPELRQQIWTMLFEDIVEEIRCVHVRDSAPGLCTYADRLRLYIDINPNHSTMWFAISEHPTRWSLLDYAFGHLSEWPPAFALSCRQIYNEAYYDLCNSTRFDFTEVKALVSWARTLTPARKRAVGEISMNMSSESFNNPGIAPAMNQLSGLRKVIFFLYTEGSPDMTAVQAHHVWELVRSVKVSEILIVTLMEVTRDTDYDWGRYKWPAGSQEAFARAVLARISRPFSRVRHRVPLGTGNQATFVLRAKRFWE